MSQDNYKVNWLKTRHIYDFDNIEIGPCSDDDIKEFIIAIGNDTDAHRSKRKQALPYWVQPKVEVSEEIKNILKHRIK